MSKMYCPRCWSADIRDLDADQDEEGFTVRCGNPNCTWAGEDRDLLGMADIASLQGIKQEE